MYKLVSCIRSSHFCISVCKIYFFLQIIVVLALLAVASAQFYGAGYGAYPAYRGAYGYSSLARPYAYGGYGGYNGLYYG